MDTLDKNPKEVLSVSDLAIYLGLSESLVRRMIHERKIPFNKIEGRFLFFLPVVREWLTKTAIQPDPSVTEAMRKEINERANRIWSKVKEE